MRHIFALLIVGALLLPAIALAGHEEATAYDRMNEIGLKGGIREVAPSDFVDDWPVNFSSTEMAVEYVRRLDRYWGAHLVVGYTSADSTGKAFGGDLIDVNLNTPYVSLGVRNHFEPFFKDRVRAYWGLGLGYYPARIKLKQTRDEYFIEVAETEHLYGANAHVGVEYVFYGDPAGKGLFDAPCGLFLEWQYVWVYKEDADAEFLDALQYYYTEYSDKVPSDLNLGGYTVLMGLRWHF